MCRIPSGVTISRRATVPPETKKPTESKNRIMDILPIAIASSTLLCALVTGFLLAFTIVVMPSIQTLSDHNFLQAFKVMDRVIQNNHPIFLIVWVGSVIALLTSAGIGFSRLESAELGLLILATVLYLVGVQLPTATINVPLNNQLQQKELAALSESELKTARTQFEPRWIRWNTIRTIVATATTVLMILLVFRI